MAKHLSAAGALGLIVAMVPAAGTPAEEPRSTPSVGELSQEVAALQMFYALDLTRPQMEALRRRAADTAAPRRTPAGRPKANGDLRRSLVELRDALLKPTDGERIERLAEKLDALRESEAAELDDGFDVTEEAVEQAPEVLRRLSPRQVALYAGGCADDIPDPRARLEEALAKSRGLSRDDWKQYRDGVAEDVAALLAGLDDEGVQRLRDRIVQLLIVARSLKDDEFQAQRRDLEKKALEIVGDVGPTEVIRHVVEQALAELLSNPRLEAALDARLKAR